MGGTSVDTTGVGVQVWVLRCTGAILVVGVFLAIMVTSTPYLAIVASAIPGGGYLQHPLQRQSICRSQWYLTFP